MSSLREQQETAEIAIHWVSEWLIKNHTEAQ